MHIEGHLDEPETTLADLGFNTRFETGAERPSFFTEERINELVGRPPPDPDPLDYELQRSEANRRFASTISRQAFDALGPNFCNLFPEAAVCAAPPPQSGESRVPRPGAPLFGGPPMIRPRPGVELPRPRPTQEQDVWEFLQSRIAEEAMLRQRDAKEAADRARGEAAADFGRRSEELKRTQAEEAFFALSPSERLRQRVTLAPGGGITRAYFSTTGR